MAAGAAAGFEPGDVILSIKGKEMASVEDYRKAVKDVKAGDKVLARVKRGQSAQFVTVKVK
jgi:S1-C subfamily serine protease